MTVPYYNTHRLSAEVEKSGHAAYVTLEGVRACADVFTLHLPHPPVMSLKGIWELPTRRPLATFVHTTRGVVVDNVALVEALERGINTLAGLDVFENEAMLNTEFSPLDNVVLTPLIASNTTAWPRQMALTAAENPVAGLTGKPPHLFYS